MGNRFQPDREHRTIQPLSRAMGSSLKAAILLAVVGGFLWGRQASAQFVVQPMKYELSVRGGQVVTKKLMLQNIRGADSRPIQIDIVDLTQDGTGRWQAIDISREGVELTAEQARVSCRSWLSVDTTSAVLKRGESKEVELTVRVPAGVRGFYCAAVRANVLPRPDESANVTVKYELIVPILIEIEGVPLLNRVELEKVEVQPIKTDSGDDSVELVFTVANTGNSMARTLGKGWIKFWDAQGKRWKPVVSEISMLNNTLIPGTRAVFRQDIGKVLPPGHYRLMGILNIEGREGKLYDEEIDFAGQVGARLIEDSAVRCDRTFVLMEGAPGRPCRGVVQLRNYSFNPVTIRAQAVIPEEMRGRIWYGRKGDDMSCHQWIEVRPEEIRLKAFGDRNVRISGRMPKTGYQSKGYYATVVFTAEYEDGSPAGQTTVLVGAVNSDKSRELNVTSHGLKVNRLDGGGERFLLSASYGNLSDVHLVPVVKARLLSMPDQQAFEEWTLQNSSQQAVMLPYEKRTFSAVLTLANIPEGDYQLESVLIDGDDVVASVKKSLKIYREGGQRIVEIAADAPGSTESELETPAVSW